MAPASVPEPARKPVPVDADGPARMIPKRAIVVHNLKGVLARSRDLDDDGKFCEECKRSSDPASS